MSKVMTACRTERWRLLHLDAQCSRACMGPHSWSSTKLTLTCILTGDHIDTVNMLGSVHGVQGGEKVHETEEYRGLVD